MYIQTLTAFNIQRYLFSNDTGWALFVEAVCLLVNWIVTLKFVQVKERGAFRVLVDTYVTEESGTGIVHQAPYFGEVCLSAFYTLYSGTSCG